MTNDPNQPVRPAKPRNASTPVIDRTLASMIEAEVNEGGPPSPVPCDTPFYGPDGLQEESTAESPRPSINITPGPSEVIHLPLGDALEGAIASTLLRTPGLQLIRLIVPKNKAIAPHRAPGELTIQCIEGHVAIRCHEKTRELKAGELIHLLPGDVHSLTGEEDSSVLVTIIRLPAWNPPETTVVP